MTEAGSSVNMADVARAFGDKKYEMFAKIVEDISGAKISGYDVISSTNFKKLLNVAGGVELSFLTMRFLTVIQRIFYRQLMQVMLFLMERQPMHYLLIWMEQHGEESSRLERVNTYLTSYMEASSFSRIVLLRLRRSMIVL